MVCSCTYTRPKISKILLFGLLFTSLTILLFASDTFISKVRSQSLSNACLLCPIKKNLTYQRNPQILHFSIFSSEDAFHNPIHVLFFFVHAHSSPKLKNKLNRCISSLFNYATPALHLHILTDQVSLNSSVEILKEVAPLAKTTVKVSIYDVNIFIEPLQELVSSLRPHFSYKQGAYYSDGLFYISIGLFRVMTVKKIILIDADVKFLDDIKFLYEYFQMFPTAAFIGMAREQQPVYRHVLYEYRRHHNSSNVGEPPPNGKTGFNSGVLLLDLEKMRNSSMYSDIIDNSSVVLNLVEKYKFKGHLGDQDFYTLISLEHPEIFYTLPCTWNRQLCQWWKHHGYKKVFNLYYSCTGRIHLYHGNCNSFIPDS